MSDIERRLRHPVSAVAHEHEAGDILRNELGPQGCSKRVDAKGAQILVEVAPLGDNTIVSTPAASARSVSAVAAMSPAASSSRAM